jgi:uncharacterized protein YeaC (DUF1315 family)
MPWMTGTTGKWPEGPEFPEPPWMTGTTGKWPEGPELPLQPQNIIQAITMPTSKKKIKKKLKIVENNIKLGIVIFSNTTF